MVSLVAPGILKHMKLLKGWMAEELVPKSMVQISHQLFQQPQQAEIHFALSRPMVRTIAWVPEVFYPRNNFQAG